MDNMQATLRACGKEGRVFRPEVESFVAFGDRGILEYDLEALHTYMHTENKRALTEAVVVGCALPPDGRGPSPSSLELACVRRVVFEKDECPQRFDRKNSSVK